MSALILRRCKHTLTLTVILLSGPFGNASACPPGSVLQTGNGWQGCVQTSSSPVWVDRWGAIATDETTGAFGSASSEVSKKKAEKYALSMCKEKGKECKVLFSYYNQCVSYVTSKNTYFIRTDSTLEQAVSNSMARCEREDEDCRVFYSRCSLPEQV